jgi:hypothetical protein
MRQTGDNNPRPADMLSEVASSGKVSSSLDGYPGQAQAVTHWPLLFLWVLFAVAVAGGLLEWFVRDRSPWEGIGAAATIAGVTKLVAKVKGIPAWPWRRT